jgi:peptidoglycan/LPS O-acetylase OafA/YrhL
MDKKDTHSPPLRFTFIDGLRGVAALMVLCFHFYNQILLGGGRPQLVWPLHELVRHGNLGVEIFFVLSGFVIAFSIRGARVTGRYLGGFALRRSLRLDPPYWVVIFLSFAVLRGASSMGESRAILPGPLGIVANMLYLNNLLGIPALVSVGWTLCLEVQFYLVLILLVGATQLAPRVGRITARVLVFAPLTLVALAIQQRWLPSPQPGLFLEFWALFFLGVLTWWTLAKENDLKLWTGYVCLLLVAAVLGKDLRLGVALATAASIMWVGQADKLSTALRHPVLQYFSRISYSLYLIHPIVGHTTIKVLTRRFAFPGATGAVVLFVLAFGAALLAAHLLHVFVERPSMRFSRTILRPTATDAR